MKVIEKIDLPMLRHHLTRSMSRCLDSIYENDIIYEENDDKQIFLKCRDVKGANGLVKKLSKGVRISRGVRKKETIRISRR